jgi:hypothetical protein
MAKETVYDDAILEQLVQEAEEAQEPGTLNLREVLHKGDDELATPMVVSALKSAGYVPMWTTDTHELRLTNKNMLRTQLQKKRADGSPVFTTRRPTQKPHRGTYKCPLHAESDTRRVADTYGLPYCTKDDIENPFEVKQHMRVRHGQEGATLDSYQRELERQEDREYQRAMVEAITAANGKKPAAKE